jgi:hypothetical protein
MKVKELIEKLSKFDKNIEIVIPVGEDEYGFAPFGNVSYRYWDKKTGNSYLKKYSSNKPNCIVLSGQDI